METFITKIEVNKSRRVSNLSIPLSDNHRQHLIITGKNGSGKTSLLEDIKTYLASCIETMFYGDDRRKYEYYTKRIDNVPVFTHFSSIFSNNNFLLIYFGAKRPLDNFNTPKGIEKVELKQQYGLDERANSDFIQYIVNLKADRSFALESKEDEDAKKIEDWFVRFENQLKDIFDDKSLKLGFDRKSYNFTIQLDGYEPFDFNTLSDGYSAIISIVTELLLRMEAHNAKAYDMEGIVLIDEIETHLHVELQKRVLPFLIAFFPKIQFIVTTHSPFVLSSIQNATICDLETRIVTTDLSAYSYDALVESYFMSDKYSDFVKDKIAEYESLLAKEEKTIEDTENIKNLQDYFAHAKFMSKELRIKLNQIELQSL